MRGGPRLPPAKAGADSLPAPLNGLLGRDEQVSELAKLLGRARLVTLTGAPGIGKTRLAQEVAGQIGGRYAGGARLVALANVTDAALLPGALAAALSVPEVAGQSITDTLVARLSRRLMLLVLDNCEHLTGACAELGESLLSGCPELSVLATSREPLGLAREAVWQVPPLAVPRPGEEASPAALARCAAVRLFVERAAAIEPGFSLNAYVAPALAEICRRLDGIPLAIELAAARVESLTPEEIARRLDDRFSLLRRSTGGDLPRHQTLRAALDWSHDLLSVPERALLRRLSVFAGGFELEAAETVCSGGGVQSGEVSDLLARLVSKSLVVADTGPSPDARYRLLETIRVYAGERLDESGEVAQARRAHAGFHLTLAERAEPELTGAGQERWFERLEAERANLRSAVEWSLSHGDRELALRLTGALVLFWRVRCHFSEGRELLEAAGSAGERAPATPRAKALWGAGFMALMTGDIDAALPSIEESLSRFRELGDRQGCARALLILGNCQQYRGDPAALTLLEESAAEAREAGDSWCLAHALAVAGFDYSSRNELHTARPLFEECLAVARAAEDKQGLRFGLIGLGSVARCQGELRLAESLLEEAVAVTGELGEDYAKATALQHLAELGMARGEYGRARQLLDEALALMREVGNPLGLPTVLALRARVAHAEGERWRARRLYEEALAPGHGRSATRASALRWMGQLAADEGDVAAARRLFEEALELARGHGEQGTTAQALDDLGQLARAGGEARRAAKLQHEALELRRQLGSTPGVATSVEAIAGLAAEAGRYEPAARLLSAAKSLRDENGSTHGPFSASSRETDLALVRAALSADELEDAFAKGAALSLEQAAAQAAKVRDELSRPAGWPSLTESEQEVAALVAEGLTNPEIAERLFISRGTVKRHLAHIFGKLGVESRTELARAVWRREEPVRSD